VSGHEWTDAHGAALRERRKQRGLSQEALAELAGVTTRTISSLEHGDRPPRSSTIQLLAEALGCHARDLKQGLRLQSIAVLPFKDFSSDQDNEYFCEGLAEELINALVHVKGLRVAARTSSFHFKDRREDLRAIGEALGVETILEGSVRRADERLRITAQLIQVDDGSHLWSEQYDRRRGDVFDIQAEISQAIVNRLQIQLQSGEPEKLIKRHTVDEEAHRLYLKGLYFWNRRLEGGLRKAIEYFQQALDRDPLYARAYAGIASSYFLLGYYMWCPANEAMPKALRAAEQALEIDDRLAMVHATRAVLAQTYEWDQTQAERRFRRAIEIDQNDATVRSWYGGVLAAWGRHDEAIAEVRRAQELDPLSLICGAHAGNVLRLAHRFEEALAEYEQVLEMDSDFLIASADIGKVYLAMGRYDEAIEPHEKGVALTGGAGPTLGYLALSYGLAGQRERARSVIDRMDAFAKQNYLPLMNYAMAYTGLGDGERASAYIEKACEAREALILIFKIDPIFDRVRGEAWFEAMLEPIPQFRAPRES
jgi:TolB-like protein/Tfp pilus assembly protein PilF